MHLFQGQDNYNLDVANKDQHVQQVIITIKNYKERREGSHYNGSGQPFICLLKDSFCSEI